MAVKLGSCSGVSLVQFALGLIIYVLEVCLIRGYGQKMQVLEPVLHNLLFPGGGGGGGGGEK